MSRIIELKYPSEVVFILLLNQLVFMFPFSSEWCVFKKLWVALTVNVFLQKVSFIFNHLKTHHKFLYSCYFEVFFDSSLLSQLQILLFLSLSYL